MKLELWIPLLFGLALMAGLLALWLQRRSGMPSGKVVAADSEHFSRLPGPLVDEAIGLVGKPDYVLATRGGAWIPVEYKSSPRPSRAYAGHVLQLAAYLRLVQAQQGKSPAYGLIRYRDKTLRVENTPELERILLAALAEMRRYGAGGQLPLRSHAEPGRCAACGFREVCDQGLA